MPWVKIDDQFSDHPKIIQAGPLASWLYVCALTYAARYLTDGFIPARKVPLLADVQGTDALADKLVQAGLWERVDGGYMIHDYLEYNPAGDEVKKQRKRNAERQSRWRERQSTDDELDESGDDTECDTADDNGVSNAVSNAVSNGVSAAAPYPYPYPGYPDTNQENDSVSNGVSNAVTNAVWRAALEILKAQLHKASFDSWLAGSRLVSLEDSVATVEVQSKIARDWLGGRLQTQVTRALTQAAGRSLRVEYVVRNCEVSG